MAQPTKEDSSRLRPRLLCYKDNGSVPGDLDCYGSRGAYGAIPFFVGNGIDTVPQTNQGFATVCQSCPVFLTAFANAFAK